MLVYLRILNVHELILSPTWLGLCATRLAPCAYLEQPDSLSLNNQQHMGKNTAPERRSCDAEKSRRSGKRRVSYTKSRVP